MKLLVLSNYIREENTKFTVVWDLSPLWRTDKDRYFQEGAKKLVPEGVEGRVAYKGTLEDTVFQMIGGIRSGMGLRRPTIEDLKRKGQFVKISTAGIT